MASEKIIRYDGDFIKKFEELKTVLEEGSKPELYAFLLEKFQYLFRIYQYYAMQIAEGDAQDFEEADEETRSELMRPLSHRQYRMIETAFLADDEEDLLSSIWNFLDDCGRIYHKKVMSSAEISGFSLILEQVYCCLAKITNRNRLT